MVRAQHSGAGEALFIGPYVNLERPYAKRGQDWPHLSFGVHINNKGTFLRNGTLSELAKRKKKIILEITGKFDNIAGSKSKVLKVS